MKNTSVIFSLSHGGLGGVTVMTLQLVEELRRRGWEAEIVITSTEQATNTLPDKNWITVLDGATLPTRWKQLLLLLETRGARFYIANADFTGSAVCSLLPQGCLGVGVLHSDDSEHYAHLHRMGNYWDGAVAVSQSIHTHLISVSSQHEQMIRVIPNGVVLPVDHPSANSNGVLILTYAGRLVEKQKRSKDLCAIVESLKRRSIPFVLRIFGSGPLEAAMKKEMADSILSGHVVFKGAVTPDELMTSLHEAHIFIQTSEYEGLSISMLQAMGAGVAPVVTKTSGATECLVQGENGYIVSVGAIEEFAETIEYLHTNREALEKVRESAKNTVSQEYSIQCCAAHWEELFEQLNGSRQGKGLRTGKLTPDGFGVHSLTLEMPLLQRYAYKIINKISVKLSSKFLKRVLPISI